jgi:SAM-dependent methyltransferase
VSDLPTRAEAKTYYEDFSLAVGLRDWLAPNRRHEALKLQVDDLLTGREELQILDVGCGAGVMTQHLSRYGSVTGIDFSSAAIDAARRLSPHLRYVVGSLDDLDGDARFDVICAFDVLEHIPARERPQFLSQVAARLAPEGVVFMSTPFPAFTRYRRNLGDDTLQIIDEEVELPTILGEAAEAGLQLTSFAAYDVFRGSPEYQAMVFTTERSPGSPRTLHPHKLDRRMRVRAHPAVALARRGRHAARMLAAGDAKAAAWFLRAKPPEIES